MHDAYDEGWELVAAGQPTHRIARAALISTRTPSSTNRFWRMRVRPGLTFNHQPARVKANLDQGEEESSYACPTGAWVGNRDKTQRQQKSG